MVLMGTVFSSPVVRLSMSSPLGAHSSVLFIRPSVVYTQAEDEPGCEQIFQGEGEVMVYKSHLCLHNNGFCLWCGRLHAR